MGEGGKLISPDSLLEDTSIAGVGLLQSGGGLE